MLQRSVLSDGQFSIVVDGDGENNLPVRTPNPTGHYAVIL